MPRALAEAILLDLKLLDRVDLSEALGLVDVPLDDHQEDHDGQHDHHVPRELVSVHLREDRGMLSVHLRVHDENIKAHQDLNRDHELVVVDARLLYLQGREQPLHVPVVYKDQVEFPVDKFEQKIDLLLSLKVLINKQTVVVKVLLRLVWPLLLYSLLQLFFAEKWRAHIVREPSVINWALQVVLKHDLTQLFPDVAMPLILFLLDSLVDLYAELSFYEPDVSLAHGLFVLLSLFEQSQLDLSVAESHRRRKDQDLGEECQGRMKELHLVAFGLVDVEDDADVVLGNEGLNALVLRHENLLPKLQGQDELDDEQDLSVKNDKLPEVLLWPSFLHRPKAENGERVDQGREARCLDCGSDHKHVREDVLV